MASTKMTFAVTAKGEIINMFGFKIKSKPIKFYEITYETLGGRTRIKSIVPGSNELQAIGYFRDINTEQLISNIVDIKPYKVGEGD